MSSFVHIARLNGLRRAWLVAVVFGVLLNAIGFAAHDHGSLGTNKVHAEVCDWCLAHAGLAPPSTPAHESSIASPVADRIVADEPLLAYPSPLLSARPRGPPFA